MRQTTILATGPTETIAASDGGLTLTVPIRIKRRSGRKVITLPEGTPPPRPTTAATPLQRALARGFRWLWMIERGEISSIKEIAQREGVDHALVSRLISMASLAPDIVAAILDETLPATAELEGLAINPQLGWDEQRSVLGGSATESPGAIRN